MVETLLLNIVECKSEKKFEEVNFEADIIAFYSGMREMMTEMFSPTSFGPKGIKLYDTDICIREKMIYIDIGYTLDCAKPTNFLQCVDLLEFRL